MTGSIETSGYSKLNGLAAFVRDNVLAIDGALESSFPGFKRNFVEPFKSVSRIEFVDIADGSACYLNAEAGVMYMNAGHVLGIISEIERQTPADQQDRDAFIAEESRLALTLFVLHEFRHASQGVIRYDDIQKLKTMGSMDTVGEFDLIADRDAAHAFALLQARWTGQADHGTYIGAFERALHFMGRYCFPAFKVPLDKMHKVNRALGITMMAARIKEARDTGLAFFTPASPYVPLDAAIICRIQPAWDGIEIYAALPEMALIAVQADFNPSVLRDLCGSLDQGDFPAAIANTTAVMKRIRVV